PPPPRGRRRPARPRRRRREPPILRASSVSRAPPWHGASWRRYHAIAAAGKPAQLARHLVRVATLTDGESRATVPSSSASGATPSPRAASAGTKIGRAHV